MDKVFRQVIKVIQDASAGQPADAVLRVELKRANLSRAESARAAKLVFAFYRWRGLVKSQAELAAQIAEAEVLDSKFQADPDFLKAADLQRTIPEWAHREVDTSPELLRAWQTEPALWLRARRGTGPELSRKLKNCRSWQSALRASTSAPEFEDCLQYLGKADLFRSPEFQNGEFEIQDVASQIVGIMCGARAGESWWDACAGEGGKTLHLSDLMENKGLIWATDRAEWRLKRLKQRASRAQVFNYRAAQWNGEAVLPSKTRFDGVLVDAPCSGVGTWQRNPHARWMTTEKDVHELAELQMKLLRHAAQAVKPGGRLIYSVCTLTRSETDAVADSCSHSLAGFEPLPMPALPNGPQAASARIWIWPQDYGGNGMFLAAWRRSR